jgi:(2S)-methylsuccinyl-CoA dehydrogenase
MAELGVFGVCIKEEYGGLGLGKLAMCSSPRNCRAAGSAPARSARAREIAGELIMLGGTEEQKRKVAAAHRLWRVLPTAVFTEPDTGSDLAGPRTRAIRQMPASRSRARKTGSPTPRAPI